jgi:hypothetical protein
MNNSEKLHPSHSSAIQMVEVPSPGDEYGIILSMRILGTIYAIRDSKQGRRQLPAEFGNRDSG